MVLAKPIGFSVYNGHYLHFHYRFQWSQVVVRTNGDMHACFLHWDIPNLKQSETIVIPLTLCDLHLPYLKTNMQIVLNKIMFTILASAMEAQCNFENPALYPCLWMDCSGSMSESQWLIECQHDNDIPSVCMIDHHDHMHKVIVTGLPADPGKSKLINCFRITMQIYICT